MSDQDKRIAELEAEVADLRRILAGAYGPMSYRPFCIDWRTGPSAPRDGTRILTYTPPMWHARQPDDEVGKYHIQFYEVQSGYVQAGNRSYHRERSAWLIQEEGGDGSVETGEPAFWMPLPEPPERVIGGPIPDAHEEARSQAARDE